MTGYPGHTPAVDWILPVNRSRCRLSEICRSTDLHSGYLTYRPVFQGAHRLSGIDRFSGPHAGFLALTGYPGRTPADRDPPVNRSAEARRASKCTRRRLASLRNLALCVDATERVASDFIHRRRLMSEACCFVAAWPAMRPRSMVVTMVVTRLHDHVLGSLVCVCIDHRVCIVICVGVVENGREFYTCLF